MTCAPGPVVDGSKILPLIPEPENVPPGKEGLSVTAASWLHIFAGRPMNCELSSITFTVVDQVSEQVPFASTWVMVCIPGPETEGVNEFPSTPGPENTPTACTGVRSINPELIHAVAPRPVN